MKRIADLLFEARMLKEIPRSGFQFLGVGRESVAEHVYSTTFIAFVMTQLLPEIDARKLLSLCLVHDLPEARIGDLNSVHKAYVQADEPRAIADMLQGLASVRGSRNCSRSTMRAPRRKPSWPGMPTSSRWSSN